MTPTCPLCGGALEPDGPGELDQCGEMVLPATQWRCPSEKCREAVVTIPTGEPARAREAA